MLCGLERRVFEERLQRDEVARRQGCAHGGFDIVGQLDRVHDAVEELGVAHVDLIPPDAGRLHASGCKSDHLGIRDWA